MSHLFLAKMLDGHAATFVRFEGADKFVIEVNGAERTISRDIWRLLPDSGPSERDRLHYDPDRSPDR
jgi:hypothetical protein